RDQAREIIGEEDFIEVFVNASLEICEARDVKGLYKKARNGEIKDFTGIDSLFEAPENPGIEIKTDDLTVEESVERIIQELKKKIELKK
ncbi:MAG: adenylyl-sulfate kinase, partial [Flavobacteriales bacterium]|nr:adenylyl-sulfate kinase [Flavobacteriales bacterium]